MIPCMCVYFLTCPNSSEVIITLCNFGQKMPPASNCGRYVKTTNQRRIGEMTIKYIKPKLPNRGHSGAIEMMQEKIYPESDVSLFLKR